MFRLIKKALKPNGLIKQMNRRMIWNNGINSSNDLIKLRNRYMSPSLDNANQQIVLNTGMNSTVCDSDGNSYIDVYGQNLCISVGHCHPTINKLVKIQLDKINHCTTMYCNSQSVLLAREIVDTLPRHPSGEDWVATSNIKPDIY